MSNERIETLSKDEQIKPIVDMIYRDYKTFRVQAIITDIINKISSPEDFNAVFSNLKARKLSIEQNERPADKELDQEEIQELVCNSISTILRTATLEQKEGFLKITEERLKLTSVEIKDGKIDFPNITKYKIPTDKIEKIRESISKDKELEAYYQQAKRELLSFNGLNEVDRPFVISYLIMILREIEGSKETELADRVEKLISEDEIEGLLSNISDDTITKLEKLVRQEWNLGNRYDRIIKNISDQRSVLAQLIRDIKKGGSEQEKLNLNSRLSSLNIGIQI